MEVCGKYTFFTEKVTSKIQTGMEKSKFHLFGFFCENWTEMGHTEILTTLQRRAGDSRGLWTWTCGVCCSTLWMGVTYNQTGKSCFKIRPAGPDFYGLWNKRNNDGAGGAVCVVQ